MILIKMTNFEPPPIDTVLSRFPNIAQDIFKELDNKSLIKCRKLGVPVQNFIDNEKFIWIRRMQKYRESMKTFLEQWKQVIRNTTVDHVKELSLAVSQFFDDDVSVSSHDNDEKKHDVTSSQDIYRTLSKFAGVYGFDMVLY